MADDSKGGARKVNIGGNFAQGTFAVVVHFAVATWELRRYVAPEGVAGRGRRAVQLGSF